MSGAPDTTDWTDGELQAEADRISALLRERLADAPPLPWHTEERARCRGLRCSLKHPRLVMAVTLRGGLCTQCVARAAAGGDHAAEGPDEGPQGALWASTEDAS